jgi:PAS domain S-box-containing protein
MGIILSLILCPLFIGGWTIRSAFENNYLECVDAFTHTEGVHLSKYISLQFENTVKELNELMTKVQTSDFGNREFLEKELKSWVTHDENIVSVFVYDEKGKFLGSSNNEHGGELPTETDKKLAKLGDKILYSIEVREDKKKNTDIMLKYTAAKLWKSKPKESQNEEKGEKAQENKKLFFELTVKWNRYEKYLSQLYKGIFPRVFYILSPSCLRHVSFNSLPTETKNKKQVLALGVHLTQKLKNIPEGLSTKKIESLEFRIFKDKIKIPDTLKGSEFFMMVVTDSSVLEAFSEDMMNKIQLRILIILIFVLIICAFMARFYGKTKEQLQIANAITDSTPLAIVTFRYSDGVITKINLSAITLFQIDIESLKTINIWNLFVEDDDKNYVSSAVSSNINVLNYEVLVQTFGGGAFWGVCSASPVEMQDEKHVVLAVLDINHRKEMEKKLANNAALLEKQVTERTADLEVKAKELEQSNALLENAKTAADEANRAKSKFLTNMSNEFKTPVNAIIGYGEILKEEALDRKDTVSADDLQKIIGSAKHLLSLINELLDLSKIESGKIQLVFENIEISNLIRDVEGVTMPLIAAGNNSLFLEYPKDIGTMYSDSTKIRQCLLNLLSNAAKFTEFGKITLRVTSTVRNGDDFVEFSVIDTGVGMESDKIAHLFEFGEENQKSSGNGLGLSLTKKYTECLGGQISAESEPGAGSKFIIRLPRICKAVSDKSVEVKNRSEEEFFDDSPQNSFTLRSDHPNDI